MKIIKSYNFKVLWLSPENSPVFFVTFPEYDTTNISEA
ncbi:Uncharacterized protein dnm_041280 [Desulfonema magnum]|uniref:Uncharacterized protein n=1 Tax=Desulfonema magnum TaxID=45655 RepID=A0A975BM51_9BACT|nr:Uncharacterized protein dnm_041280 [Desulfonema magnum]